MQESSSSRAPLLLVLPVELCEQILIHAGPRAVARASQSCRTLYAIVQREDDNHIWRSLFLDQFDTPRLNPTSPYDWKTHSKRRFKAELVIQSTSALHTWATRTLGDSPLIHPHEPWSRLQSPLFEYQRDLQEAYATCVDIYRTASSPPNDSKNLTWLEEYLYGHRRFLWPHDESTPEDHEGTVPSPTDTSVIKIMTFFMAANQDRLSLRAFTGIHNEASQEMMQPSFESTRLDARAFVYDLRKYREEYGWGPWERFPPPTSSSSSTGPGSLRSSTYDLVPNWEHINHLMTLIAANIDEYAGGTHLTPTFPTSITGSTPTLTIRNPIGFNKSSCIHSFSGLEERPAGDWAGVQGFWKRVVCFIDYGDLEEYNFGHDPYDRTIFAEQDFGEALRVLLLHLEITEIVDPSTPGLFDPSRPTIMFGGRSYGGSSDMATLRGNVSVMKSGDIRWSFVSNFQSGDRWHAEGVQLGGAASAAGVVGSWGSVEHYAQDPAGPFWMWKMEEEEATAFKAYTDPIQPA